MANQTILGINCTYLGEPLAAMILFREGDKPFTEEDEAVLKMISPVFACALASAVKGEEQEGGEGAEGGGEEGGEDGNGRKTEERSDADWWKRGESPPF